MSIAMVIK